ncbi:MAG TPA: SPOR domain-containing protein [Blastocatellia bacterium]|nr:SPOR domain-containing protein [Blastocatellia bacterium]
MNPSRDLYATRIGDDFDDVLDIPRPVQSNSQTNYDSPIFDDVFTTPEYDYTAAYDYSTTEKKATSQVDNFQAGISRQRETQDYVAAAEPEFMGWPLLPENSIDEDDSVGETKSRRGGLILRVAICVVIFGGLIGGAYYFLGDLIKFRDKEAATPPPAKEQVARQPEAKGEEKPPASEKPGSEAVLKSKNEQGGVKQIEIPPVPASVEGPKGVQAKPAALEPIPNRGNITIQVASFKDLAQASDRVATLKSQGVEARIVDAEIPGNGTWHRVYIGRFLNRDEARNFGNQLRDKGTVGDFLVTPVN